MPLTSGKKNKQKMSFLQTNSKYVRKLSNSLEAKRSVDKTSNIFQSTLNNHCMVKAGFFDPLPEYSEQSHNSSSSNQNKIITVTELYSTPNIVPICPCTPPKLCKWGGIITFVVFYTERSSSQAAGEGPQVWWPQVPRLTEARTRGS